MMVLQTVEKPEFKLKPLHPTASTVSKNAIDPADDRRSHLTFYATSLFIQS
jgi:hypothetical protein